MMCFAKLTKAATLAIVAATVCVSGAFAEPFILTSTSFKEGGMMDKRYTGKLASNPNCTGENVSPALAWTNTPAGAKSLVLVVYGWEGLGGFGVDHLVAYNIKPTVAGFAEGELSQPSDKFTGGKGTGGTTVYRGPCPPLKLKTHNHHYLFKIIATDLEPTLPAGLTRDELWEKIKGHTKGATGLVGIYDRE